MEREVESLKDVLIAQGEIVQPVVGVSMRPLLRAKKDSVVISSKVDALKPLDVALYIRENDGAYVLHRILCLNEDEYIIRGDNCYSDEHVKKSAVIGVMKGFFRGNKYVSCDDKKYLKYSQKIVKSYPIRKRLVKVKWKIKSLCRRIIKGNK